MLRPRAAITGHGMCSRDHMGTLQRSAFQLRLPDLSDLLTRIFYLNCKSALRAMIWLMLLTSYYWQLTMQVNIANGMSMLDL